MSVWTKIGSALSGSGRALASGSATLVRRLAPGRGGEDSAYATTDAPPPEAMAAGAAATAATGRRRRWLWIALLALVPLYYAGGALLTHRINDDLDFKAQPSGGSRAVATIAALIDREVNKTAWAPNIQGFQPAALLRWGGNMANFQSGLVKALSTLVTELDAQTGRVRGAGAADPDLGLARQGLSRQPDTWILDPWPTSSAEQEYRRAMRALTAYNVRLAAGQAVFERRADTLQAVLNRVALDIGSTADGLDRQIAAGREVFIDTRADKLFHFARGQAYAHAVVLRALREDFSGVIAERRVGTLYDAMLTDLEAAARLDPLIVQNAAPGGALLPNHLAAEGFHLMRARARLREITDVLQR